MSQTNTPSAEGAAAGQSGGSPRPIDFETAQHDLFDTVGLDVRSRFVELDEPRVRVHVFEAGPAEGHHPLLFVHGGGSFGAFLAPLIAQLDDDWVVGFDRPGYGLSDDFLYQERTLRRTDIDVLDGVIDDLGVEQVDLVGHSMGGYASVQYALARPDRVRRLVLIGACAAFPGARPPLPLRLMTVPLLNRFLLWVQQPGEAGILDVAEIFGEREAVQANPALLQAMVAHEGTPKSSKAGLSELSAFFSIRGWHPSVRIHDDDLRAIQQPTLIIWGDDDPIGSPDDVRAGVEAIPDVRFETVPAAHGPFLTYPERCAEYITAFRSQ